MGNRVRDLGLLLVLAATILAACGPVPAPAGIEKTIYVGPTLVDCEGVAPQKCMLVKENPEDDWTLYYDQIEGFDYEEGYEYELRIREEQVEDPPADASSIRWTLVEVANKIKAEQPEPSAGLEDTIWVLDSYVDDQGQMVDALPGSQITAEFRDGQLTGNAGCNSLFGSYIVSGDSLTIGPLAMTEMYCAPEELMAQESAYLNALQQAATYQIAEGWLQIADLSGNTVLSYSVLEPLPILGTTWKLVAYNKGLGMEPVLDGTETTAILGSDGLLTGSGGCNNYTAQYTLEGNTLSIAAVSSTRMMCPEPPGGMEQEAAYLTALESVSYLEVRGESLEMFDADGQKILAYQAYLTMPLVGTLWQLTAYNNGKMALVSPLPDTEITATFSEDGRMGGSSGCNNYAASYEVAGDRMTIGQVASTMMMCPEPIMEQESAYLTALEWVAAFNIQGRTLELTDIEGKIMMAFDAVEPTPLVDTPWQVSSYNNGRGGLTSPLVGTEITAVFGQDGQVTGSTGCNNYFSAYEADESGGLGAGTISIGSVAATRMMCDQPEGIMDQESEYLAALESAATYQIEGDTLELLNAEGTRAVVYTLGSDVVPGPEDAGLSEEALRNMEYKSEWTQSGTALLTDGEYREQAAPGSATETVVMLTDYVAYGELNGQPAAAAILVTDPGGSGTFYDLTVVIDQDGQPVNVATASLGDRAQINSLTIEDNQIIVDMITHGPNDPMCCPTQQVVQIYELQGDQLLRISSETIGSGAYAGLEIVGVVWKWEKFLESNDNTIIVPKPDNYSLEFLPDGQVHIKADCNTILGTYTVQGSQLTIELGPTTLAACPPGSLDDEYLQALQDVNSYMMDGDNLALAIKYDSGVMTFAPGE